MKVAEKRHLNNVASLGCCICGGEAEIHHVHRGGAIRDHMQVIPLCPMHHRLGGYGVAIEAGKRTWEDKHGTQEEWLDWVSEQLNGSIN